MTDTSTRTRTQQLIASAQETAPPPLEHGDRLSCEEFERRYEAMPELKKAELIEGVVYIVTDICYRPQGEHALLPLVNSEHLTLEEFERRYEAMPELKKAELIEGVVYVSSPVRHYAHGKPTVSLSTWAGTYYAATPNVDASDNATVRLPAHTAVQPDVLLRLEPACGGRSHVTEKDYIEGPPELIIEVAASSASYDLHDKRAACEQAGVQEYLVWQVYERRIDWWELRDGRYAPLPRDEHGIIESRAFPGLRLDTAALLAGNLAAVLATLQQGTSSAAHAAFVARLKALSPQEQEGEKET